MATPFADNSDKAKEKRKSRGLSDHLWFCKTYLPHHFDSPWAPFHPEWVSLPSPKPDQPAITPEVISGFRGTGKSTFFTLGMLTHKIVYGLIHYLIVGSETEDSAAEKVNLIRLELENNERIRQDFGDLKGHFGSWGEKEFITKNNAKVLARGVGQVVRGLKFRQWRPDYFMGDDLESNRTARSPDVVKKQLDWLKDEVYPALDPKGMLVIVGNMLTKRCLMAHLVHHPDYSGWNGHVYKSLDNEGAPTWPEKFSKLALELIKRTIGTVSFEKEYQMNPSDEDGAFREEWYRYYHAEELSGRQLRIASGSDASMEAGRTHDYKAIVSIGQDQDGTIYVLDAFIQRTSIDQFLRVHYNRYNEYSHFSMGLEDNLFQKLLFRDFDRLAAEKKQHLPLKGITNTINKETRIISLSPLVERGIIRFRRGHSDQDRLLEQLTYFPSSAYHDDGPDALEMAVRQVNSAAAVCLGKDPEKEEGPQPRRSLSELFRRNSSDQPRLGKKNALHR